MRLSQRAQERRGMVLEFLKDHPGEKFDYNKLRERVGLGRSSLQATLGTLLKDDLVCRRRTDTFAEFWVD